MKYSYFGFGMLLFGSIGLVIIVMMQSVTINNDSEYYNLKEAMEASMMESIDYVCYRVEGKTVTVNEEASKNNDCGYLLKMSEQKFVENFTRRFAATLGGDAKKYTLEFYDIIESPPKASVVVKGLTNDYGIVSQNEGLTITNSLSGILQLKKGVVGKYDEYFDPNEFEEIKPSSDAASISNKTSDAKTEVIDGYTVDKRDSTNFVCGQSDSISCSDVPAEGSADPSVTGDDSIEESEEDSETCVPAEDEECED